MNIQEVEFVTGMTRANIRYYEKRGFLSPERRENSYRDYSEEDIRTLKRIKLLRQLDISLDTLARLEKGEITLKATLDERILAMENEIQMADQQLKLCRKMRDEGATYQNLRVDSYLCELEREKESVQIFSQLMQEDQELPVISATRRVIARYTDWLLYTVMVNGLFHLVQPNLIYAHYNTKWLYIFISSGLGLVVMCLIEPFMLTGVGTTFGKWILGLRIRNFDGRKMQLKDAKVRTRRVMLYWLFSWSGPNYERYHAMEKNESMLWEGMDEVWASECEPRHVIVGLLAIILLLFALCYLNLRIIT